MRLSYYISKKIIQNSSNSFSSLIHKIAIWSIGIGLGLMIISFMILDGFQSTIRNKILQFSGDIYVNKYTLSNSYEEEPISTHNLLLEDITEFPNVESAYPVSHKPGLIKTDNEVSGVVIKGVQEDYKDSGFTNSIIDGQFPNLEGKKYSKEILISEEISNKLNITTGDEIIVYFIQNPPKARKLKISGIYYSGIEDFDDKMIIGDLRMLQKLNNWPDTLTGGIEVHLKSFNNLYIAEENLNEKLPHNLYVEPATSKFSDIFDWLNMLNTNVVVFLTLILAVASFNMISVVLILIMERTQMIGLMKAMGATNRLIRKIFAYQGILLIGKGLLLGNIIGIGFGFLQDTFHILPLDPESYYMSYVPIEWNFLTIVLLNVLTYITISLVLIIPTIIISRINPIKAIKFV
ncbi:ABC transporter permease [Aureibacter tunicatorum]|nr:FtsX-like permease family protein [Aureibacter tunicatorum]BDD03689.1 ABC transporter permease [Aureibacter tunicatorum]